MLKTMFKSMIRTPAFRRALSWVLAAVSGVFLVLAILGRPLPLPRIFGNYNYVLPLILWNILLTYFPSTPRRKRLDRISTWCLIVSIVLMVIIGVVYIRYSTPQWINMESVLSLFFIPLFLSQFYRGCILPWDDTKQE